MVNERGDFRYDASLEGHKGALYFLYPVKLSPDQSENWSTEEVLRRWTTLFKGPLLVQHFLSGKTLTTAEYQCVHDCAEVYRKRLGNLSWFMKCLNEPISREANKEDNCTGHFFEGRFHSQALLTEQAVLTCMAYVDLNPVRAGIAKTPETSDHTSIKERIQPVINLQQAIQEQTLHAPKNITALKPLLAFEGNTKEAYQPGLPFFESDYLALVNQTGRCIRDDKRGAISNALPPILTRLGLDQKLWLENATAFEKMYQARFAQKRKRIKQTA